MNQENKNIEDISAVEKQKKTKEKRPINKKKIIVLSIILCLIIILSLTLRFRKEIINVVSDNTEVKNVTANKINGQITMNDSKFTIIATGTNVKELSKHIYLEPSLEYEIVKVKNDTYELSLNGELSDNTIFNVGFVENGVINNKWAFQTKKDLSVNSTYPANDSDYVDVDTGIEIYFSYPDIDNLEEKFTITPEVTGSFENDGRIYKFIPNEPLKEDTKYTITIEEGLTSNGQTLKEPYTFSFATYKDYNQSDEKYDAHNEYTIDKISTFKPDEQPILDFSSSILKSIKLSKFNNYEDFLSYIRGNTKIKTKDLGKADYSILSFPEEITKIQLNDKISEGYYLATFLDKKNNAIYSYPIQSNSMSAYAIETERDILVWVAKNDELQKDINVKYKEQNVKTDENGIATFKDISSFDEKIDYMLVGNDNNPLIIGFKNYKDSTYPDGYIYTDRPLYKNTDKVNIWGYIPLNFFYDKPDLSKFYMKFNEEIVKVDVKENGTFTATIELDNYATDYSYVELFYKNDDNLIAERYFEIEDYKLLNYTYIINMDKTYYTSGDTINFSVEAKHISGFPAVEKNIRVSFDGKNYDAKTDSNGMAYFTIKTSKVANKLMYEAYEAKNIYVYPGGVDSTEDYYSTSIYQFNSNIKVSSQSKEDNKVAFSAKYYNLNTDESIDDPEELISGNYNGSAKLSIVEYHYQRTIAGYEYDEYENKKVANYNYSHEENLIDSYNIKFADGEYLFEPSIDYKENDEFNSYDYYVKLQITDKSNNEIIEQNYFHYGDFVYQNEDDEDYSNSIYNSAFEFEDYDYSYNIYKYELNIPDKITDEDIYFGPVPQYSIGDKIDLGLYDYQSKINNEGKILKLFYKEGIIDKGIIDDNNINSSFKDDYYPGANVTGAYLLNGNFYRLPSYYLDYNEEDSNLFIEIKTDKQNYRPQDKVKTTIVVKDKNGELVDADLNISVVDEAIFNTESDTTNILERVYSDKYYRSYTYSSYKPNELYNMIGGAGDAGGSNRNQFGDTIYFGTAKTKNGKAEVNFTLNDKISSIRITVHAANKNAQVGSNKKVITSTLPLSISSVPPVGLKNTDDFVINASSINGSSNNIKYSFTIKETNQTLEQTGKIGETVFANFGKMNIGTYTVVIKATDGKNSDSVEYKVNVIDSNQIVKIKKTESIRKGITITPKRNPIIVEIYHKNMSKYISYLDFLEKNYSSRLDTQIAYNKSIEYSNRYYEEERKLELPDFTKYLAEDGIVKSLQSADKDYILTGLIAYYAKDYEIVKATAKGLNISVKDDEDDVIKKLFVLSALKEPVLVDVHSIKDPYADEQKLLVGLSNAFLGDYDTAKKIFNTINKKSLTDTNLDLYILLSSFVAKDKTGSLIDNGIKNRPTSNYLMFAILSYFQNNDSEISKDINVKVKSDMISKEIKINGAKIGRLSIYDKDLNNLSIKSQNKDLMVSYYYLGGVDEQIELKENIKISLPDKIETNSVINLIIDTSKIKKISGQMSIVLPSSLMLNNTHELPNGVYLMKNEQGRMELSFSKVYDQSQLEIPLYVTSVGEYKFEPVIFNHEDVYYSSNSETLKVEEKK